MGNRAILVISDTHFPYAHPATIRFLAAIKDKYEPDRVIHIGDEVDNHAMSFHPSDTSESQAITPSLTAIVVM